MHSVCVIHHIRLYQSYNEDFGSTPMLSCLSHSAGLFSPLQIINSLIPFSLQKYSNTEVARRLKKLSCEQKVTSDRRICNKNLNECIMMSISVRSCSYCSRIERTPHICRCKPNSVVTVTKVTLCPISAGIVSVQLCEAIWNEI